MAFVEPAQPVLPAGLDRADNEHEPTPARLGASVGDAFDHFRLLASLAETAQAPHLLEHVQAFGVSVLCRDHGLPMAHTTPPRSRPEGVDLSLSGVVPAGATCYAPRVPGTELGGLSVPRAAALARFFDAVLDASVRIRRRQAALPRHLVYELTAMPFVPIAGLIRAEYESDGGLKLPRQRQLVSLAAEGFLQQTATRSGVSWVGYQRPELVMKTESVWGVYALEMVRRLSLDDERPETYSCAVCGTPVRLSRRPRAGDQTYCKTPECQRERVRRNKQRQRVASKG